MSCMSVFISEEILVFQLILVNNQNNIRIIILKSWIRSPETSCTNTVTDLTLLSFPLQKADTTEEVESVEPPKPEKKKTRKGKKGGASPEDEEADEGEGQLDEERNGEQKDNEKVRNQ